MNHDEVDLEDIRDSIERLTDAVAEGFVSLSDKGPAMLTRSLTVSGFNDEVCDNASAAVHTHGDPEVGMPGITIHVTGLVFGPGVQRHRVRSELARFARRLYGHELEPVDVKFADESEWTTEKPATEKPGQ